MQQMIIFKIQEVVLIPIAPSILSFEIHITVYSFKKRDREWKVQYAEPKERKKTADRFL